MIKFFKKLKQLFEEFFFGKPFQFFQENSEIAIKVVNHIKSIVESDAVGFGVNLTATNIDNLIVEKLKSILPVVSEKMLVLHAIVNADSGNDSIAILIDHLKSITKGQRESFWIMLAGELNVALADGEISRAEGIALTQLFYSKDA
ncbi:hypothetical protein J2X69_003027 [Algoriphagus sp. 4150]|uniref:hypothetical protein n=1 Tax=Algoriphagus sp. 4150 TaxID=2817756 RepID=UPI002854DB8A|nr:hypothetical protein [Algoriphagus sp. 4150]MDR7130670.1 hypothetical protein [Algoriphagus sp. 4150]